MAKAFTRGACAPDPRAHKPVVCSKNHGISHEKQQSSRSGEQVSKNSIPELSKTVQLSFVFFVFYMRRLHETIACHLGGLTTI